MLSVEIGFDGSSPQDAAAVLCEAEDCFRLFPSWRRSPGISDDQWAAAARRDYAFHLIPMANPDGVYDGKGRLTAPRGADLEWIDPAVPDRAGAAVLAALDRLRPVIFVDLHNWQSKVADGLFGLTAAERTAFFHSCRTSVWPVSSGGCAIRCRCPSRVRLASWCRATASGRTAPKRWCWSGAGSGARRMTFARWVRRRCERYCSCGSGGRRTACRTQRTAAPRGC
jgi:hypothetical protein